MDGYVKKVEDRKKKPTKEIKEEEEKLKKVRKSDIEEYNKKNSN